MKSWEADKHKPEGGKARDILPRVFSLKKIIVHQKKSEKSQKIQGLFLAFKIRITYLGVKNSSNSWRVCCGWLFKSFFIIKSSYTQKNPEKNPKKSELSEKNRKKIRKIWKNPINTRIFLRIKNPYTLFGSEQPLGKDTLHYSQTSLIFLNYVDHICAHWLSPN